MELTIQKVLISVHSFLGQFHSQCAYFLEGHRDLGAPTCSAGPVTWVTPFRPHLLSHCTAAASEQACGVLGIAEHHQIPNCWVVFIPCHHGCDIKRFCKVSWRPLGGRYMKGRWVARGGFLGLLVLTVEQASRGVLKESESESCSAVSDSFWPHGLDSPWNSPGQNTGVGSLSLLQGIFPTQGSNPGLLQCRRILYQLSHKGSPRTLQCIAYPFSSGSLGPRNWTGVSCIAGDSLPTELSGMPGGKEPTCQCRRPKRCGFSPWVRKIPWKRAWQPTPVFLPGESHGQRSLVG